ncbi:MAG: polysaccharide deacetylase family protein, partial [Candidatus Hydrogenedentota bacterium]
MSCLVTTSWDDGNRLDMKLAGILRRYGFRGTLYIPGRSPYKSMSDAEIRELSAEFEIGAHTMTHPDLTSIDPADAAREISQSKDMVQQLVGKDARMFCYPKGRYNERIRDAVEATGFAGARTVEPFGFSK